MFKKINNIIFLVLFFTVLFLPLLFTRWESGGISEEENRNLAAFPAVSKEGHFNGDFTKEFETWFRDHMGFRQKLIDANKTLMQEVFDRSLTNSDMKTGRTGDSIYASEAIILDFAHANLRTEDEVARIGNSYQAIRDWLAVKGIPFYYVQCVDKHTVYPERFLDTVRQIGDISKTDQVIKYMETETTVEPIYFKELFLENKGTQDAFSHWGDPTHWNHRGAYLAYRYMMEQIAGKTQQPLKILTEADYTITFTTHYGPEGESEQVEVLRLKAPSAQKTDVSVMGQWATDQRHSVWKNPEAGNDLRLLLMGDSYINSYLIDDIAESFAEVWLVWGDYTKDLPQILELCDPDMVIYECAERVDRSEAVCQLAESLPQ